MTSIAIENEDFIGCWNEILTPKWLRFRHLLSGNGKIHSDVAIPRFDVRPGPFSWGSSARTSVPTASTCLPAPG